MEKKVKKVVKKKRTKKDKKKQSFINKFFIKVKDFFYKLFSKSFKFDFIDILIIIVVISLVSSLATGFIIKLQTDKNVKFNSVIKDSELDKFISVYNEIVDKYYEEVDEDELVNAGIDGMLNHLEDKYSIYIENKDSSFSNDLDSTYEGIGIATIENVVYDVYEGSSAYREGIKKGDIIVSVNGYSINNKNYKELNKKLKENDGTNEIGILRGDEELAFKVTIETIVVPTVSSKVYEVKGKKIGYIDIDSFSKNTFEEFQEERVELEKAKIEGLIIDLRNNSGGYINSASNIANVFLKKDKKIYSLVYKDKSEDVVDKTDEALDYKVVVLVNNSTASSAEILTGALKDSYGALVVGNQTYGKGTVQTVKYYDDTAIKYTSAIWKRPNGESVDEVGIKPDYEVDNVIKNNILEDKQFDRALQLFK